MKTPVDIDDAVLRAAEARACAQGIPLGVLIEDALGTTVKTAVKVAPAIIETSIDQGLDENDPFFVALEEIRTLGRLPGPHRDIRFP